MLAVSSEAKLKEAADLLTILEQLCLSYSTAGSPNSLPWDGIRLTLEQSRQRIEEVRGAAVQAAPAAGQPRAATLASRIQKVPPRAAGQVREIPIEETEDGVG